MLCYNTELQHRVKCLTQNPADSLHSAEHGAGEADTEPQGDSVRQAQPKRLVLGGEVQSSIRMDPTFIECPGCPQDPLLLLLPPNCMV